MCVSSCVRVYVFFFGACSFMLACAYVFEYVRVYVCLLT